MAYPSALCHRILVGNPGPGRVDHFHHHAPAAQRSPRNRAARQLVASTNTEHQGSWCEPFIRWKPSKPTSRTTDHDRADAQQQQVVRHCRGPLKTAGVDPLIIKDSDLYPQPRPTPGHPHQLEELGSGPIVWRVAPFLPGHSVCILQRKQTYGHF